MKPVLRTSLKDEIYRGNLLYVEGRFYLIADDVQEAPNCFMTHATPCLHFVKVSRKVNPQTDKFGFAGEDTGGRSPLFSCVDEVENNLSAKVPLDLFDGRCVRRCRSPTADLHELRRIAGGGANFRHGTLQGYLAEKHE